MITDTSRSPYAKALSIPFEDVRWTGGLYQERQDTLARVTVPHLLDMFEDRNISHVLENFRIAAGDTSGDFSGTVFGDGDFYKWFEAAAYTAVYTDDRNLLDRLEEYVALFSRAQQPDGYLSTKQIILERQGKGFLRQKDINDFEIYNIGHLFTSACLYFRLTGRDNFLKVAEKAAEYLKGMYKTATITGEVKTAVCPSHYMGLIELYRTTGNRDWLDLARLAVELRDSVKDGQDDNQDRLPLRLHRKIEGHAVRANYLYAGLADLYLEEGNPEYREVLDSVWHHLIARKMYITGGCGALYNGASPYGNFFHHQLVHQAYGYDYQLPNVTAYCETCASAGAVLWGWRMFLAEPKAQTMDIIERIMLNVNLAGISLDGRKFFYENMLRRAGKLPYELLWDRSRTEYITSYCCPPNLARIIAQASEYAYAADADGVWTGLYGANTARFRLQNGADFTLVQETDYPFSGRIAFRVEKSNGVPFELRLRVPAWASGARISGESESLVPGYFPVKVSRPKEFTCVLELPFLPRLTVGHDLIEECRNQACVEAGPLVYCLESADLPEGVSLPEILLPLNPEFIPGEVSTGGLCVPCLETTLLRQPVPESEREALYRPLGSAKPERIHTRLIPYYAWDNRGFGEMSVWLPLAWREA